DARHTCAERRILDLSFERLPHILAKGVRWRAEREPLRPGHPAAKERHLAFQGASLPSRVAGPVPLVVLPRMWARFRTCATPCARQVGASLRDGVVDAVVCRRPALRVSGGKCQSECTRWTVCCATSRSRGGASKPSATGRSRSGPK